MFEYAKHEFSTWLNQLDKNQLNIYQNSLINIICKHFDDIAAVGTVNGKRAKLLAEYISELNPNCSENSEIIVDDENDEHLVERLISLKVEKFRGFNSPIAFNFDSQYTLFYGPNGSGKTSFCEALEYSMLGTIEESSSRNIPLEKYVLPAGSNKCKLPELTCRYNDGNIKKCEPNISAYRFAFIEKNRIEAFSHIGATSAKNQTERIAMLFGLSEFQEFVNGFTNELDERYLKFKSETADKCNKNEEIIKEKEKQLDKQREGINPLKIELSKIIEEIGNPDIKDADSALQYLNDPDNGLISKASKKAGCQKKPLINKDLVDQLLALTDSFLSSFDTINKFTSIVMHNVESVNLMDFYNAILKVQNSWNKNICPACHTPLDKAKDNPFAYAKEEVNKFETIENAKNEINNEAKKVYKTVTELKTILKNNPLQYVISSISFNTINDVDITEDDFQVLSIKAKKIYKNIEELKAILNAVSLDKRIDKYNEIVTAENQKYDLQIGKLQNLSQRITEDKSAIEAVEKTINETNEILEKEKESLSKDKMKAQKELSICEFNKEIAIAYKEIVKNIQSYMASLPSKMASDLSKKALDYFNVMNSEDAKFEMLSELKLPVSKNDRILVKMCDGTTQDAMLLLSEGHVRLLGLAILLAKAVTARIPFIIFDDVVNAIDDDHRNGVARLLMDHEDFKNIQMILTCHGEVFLSMLNDMATNKKAISRYVFLPADSLDERGIVIKYQDPTIPISTARNKFEANELKDCAAKCRQAVECITGKLWGKISPHTKSGISVPLRNLKSSPDLNSVANALKAETKKIEGLSDIHLDLTRLTEQSMWRLLNKGTHIDNSISEFNRGEVRELLELVEHLSKAVDEVKIKSKNST